MIKEFHDVCGFKEPQVSLKQLHILKNWAKLNKMNTGVIDDMAFVGMSFIEIFNELKYHKELNND